MVDWRCTKGGNWSTYFYAADPRCLSFCADKDHKYCADTPELAEKMQIENDPDVRAQLAAQTRASEDAEKMWISKDKVFCQGLGFKPETDAFANCLLTRLRDHKAEEIQSLQDAAAIRESARASNAARENSIQNAIQNSKPTITNCNKYGNNVSCTSF